MATIVGNAGCAIAWVQAELQRQHERDFVARAEAEGVTGEAATAEAAGELTVTPPLSTSPVLCTYLRDGRALCMLLVALERELPEPQRLGLPRKITRSMHNLSPFHGLERVQYFIKWCRRAAQLEEHLVFTTVHLLDEENADAACATMDALRLRFRPGFSYSRWNTLGRAAGLGPGGADGNKLNAFLSQFPGGEGGLGVPTASTPTESKRSLVARMFGSRRGSTASNHSDGNSSSGRGSLTATKPPTPTPTSTGLPRSQSRSSMGSSRGSSGNLAAFAVPTARVNASAPIASSTPPRSPVPAASSGISGKEEAPASPGTPKAAAKQDDNNNDGKAEEETTTTTDKPLRRTGSRLSIPAAFSGAPASSAPVSAPAPAPVATSNSARGPRSSRAASGSSKLAAFLSTVEAGPPSRPFQMSRRESASSSSASQKHSSDDDDDVAEPDKEVELAEKQDHEEEEEVQAEGQEEEEEEAEGEQDEPAVVKEEVVVSKLSSPERPASSSRLFAFLSKVVPPTTSSISEAAATEGTEENERGPTIEDVDDLVDDEEEEEEVGVTSSSAHSVAVPGPASAELVAENESLRSQLSEAEAMARAQTTELEALREQLQGMKEQLAAQEQLTQQAKSSEGAAWAAAQAALAARMEAEKHSREQEDKLNTLTHQLAAGA